MALSLIKCDNCPLLHLVCHPNRTGKLVHVSQVGPGAPKPPTLLSQHRHLVGLELRGTACQLLPNDLPILGQGPVLREDRVSAKRMFMK